MVPCLRVTVDALTSVSVDKSGSAVRAMFSRVAPRYDLLNRVLSGGMDVAWRRKAVALLDPKPGERVLDVGSGTGDLALEIHRRTAGRTHVLAADFTFAMLSIGQAKFRGAGAAIPEANADGLHLPFRSGSFQGATAAFSVRNFEDTGAGLREIRRVLAPGGRFVILEFTPEPTGPLAPLVLFHVRRVVPVLGRLVSGDTGAYSYLPDSVSQWPAPAALASRLKEAGFSEATWTPLIFGIAAIHVARV